MGQTYNIGGYNEKQNIEVVATAKANGLIPFDYLRDLFEELPKTPEDIDYRYMSRYLSPRINF